MKFYRYEINIYGSVDEFDNPCGRTVRIGLQEFNLVKETPKGYWIARDWDCNGEYKRWVSKTAKKRYAYPTKEEARTNFIKRTERRIEILEAQIATCRDGLYEIDRESLVRV